MVTVVVRVVGGVGQDADAEAVAVRSSQSVAAAEGGKGASFGLLLFAGMLSQDSKERKAVGESKGSGRKDQTGGICAKQHADNGYEQ